MLLGVVSPLIRPPPPPGIKSFLTLMLLPNAESFVGGKELFAGNLGVDGFCRGILFDETEAGGTEFCGAAAGLVSGSDSESDSSELELLESLESLPLELEFPPPPDLLLLCIDWRLVEDCCCCCCFFLDLFLASPPPSVLVTSSRRLS